MKTFKTIILAVAAMGLFAACENDKFYYQDEARARIEGPYEWALGTDSILFSFASYPSEVTAMEMNMNVVAMGNTSSTDRVVSLELVTEKTTAQANQYSFPNQVTIPAGAYEGEFTITLQRTPDLEDKNAVLAIRVVESADFKVGVVEQNHFKISWNDMLSKPKNWDKELFEFFGKFSLVKYRFIIDVIGFGDFDLTKMSWSELMNYKIVMSNALSEYNETHPGNPLTDENGELVTF